MQSIINRSALVAIAEEGRGPYSRSIIVDGRPVNTGGYWHKESHRGPDDCAGCAVEKALSCTLEEQVHLETEPKTWRERVKSPLFWLENGATFVAILLAHWLYGLMFS